MGVIQRQGIRNSLVNYFGIAIGALSTILIYPLDLELYGLIQLWIATASFLFPFLTLGSHSLIHKFFPYFNKNEGFLKYIILLTLFIIVIMSGVLYGLKEIVFQFNIISESKIKVLKDSFLFIYFLSILFIYIGVFQTQASNFKRIVIPDIIHKLSFKFFSPIIFLLAFYKYISIFNVQIGLLGFYSLILFFLIIYLKYIGALDIYGTKALLKIKEIRVRMRSFMLYNLLDKVGNMLAYQIDKIMIGTLITTTATGIYSIFFFMISFIDIPLKSIFQISNPIISQLFVKKNYKEIEKIYKSSSINLFIAGVFLFLLIWINLHNLFQIIPNGEQLRVHVMLFIFLGLSKLVDMITSTNSSIIIYSKLYRFNILFIVILAVLNVGLNIFLIPIYGLTGAGMATAISIIMYNIIKTIFVYIKMGMQPLSSKHIYPFFILLVTLFLNEINFISNPYINTVLISSLFTLIFILIIYFTKSSIEINSIISKYFRNILNSNNEK